MIWWLKKTWIKYLMQLQTYGLANEPVLDELFLTWIRGKLILRIW